MSDTAYKLKKAFELVDQSAFPQKPLQVVMIPSIPEPGQPQFGFANVVDANEGAYFLYIGGLEQYIAAGREFCIHTMLESDDPMFDPMYRKGFAYFTEEETLMAVSCHEVRHRVQFHLRVELLNRGHTDQIPRCRQWGELQDRHYKNVSGGNLEFDAKFFEFYGANELRRNRFDDIEKIGRVLRMGPQQVLTRERKMLKK